VKQNFIYPLLYTIVGGIIVTLINSALFTPKPHRDNVGVTHNVVEMDQDSAMALISSWLAKTPLTKEQSAQFLADLPLKFSGSNVAVDTYVVENRDTKVFKDLTIYVDDADLVVLRDDAETKTIPAKVASRYPELLPGKSIKLITISTSFGALNWYNDHQNTTFVLNGSSIPVVNLRVNPESSVYSLAKILDNYSFGIVMFVFLSGGLWIILLVIVVVAAATAKNIPFKARNATDGDLALSVQILDYLQEADPKRLERIKGVAEANKVKAAAEQSAH